MQAIDFRSDLGPLFENFMIAERLKYLQLQSRRRKSWFWRTHKGKEIDYIEEYGGQFDAYEFKWGAGEMKKSTIETFENYYKNTTFTSISRTNYFEFLK